MDDENIEPVLVGELKTDFSVWWNSLTFFKSKLMDAIAKRAFKAGWNALAERIITEHKNNSYHPYPSPHLCTECELLFRAKAQGDR